MLGEQGFEPKLFFNCDFLCAYELCDLLSQLLVRRPKLGRKLRHPPFERIADSVQCLEHVLSLGDVTDEPAQPGQRTLGITHEIAFCHLGQQGNQSLAVFRGYEEDHRLAGQAVLVHLEQDRRGTIRLLNDTVRVGDQVPVGGAKSNSSR
jgi:hypothetical protein